MARKNNFLSIGAVAKYTGASIDSLRYYERLKLLEPAFTDPDSRYRYYSFDQIYLIEIISLCIELDIPLKELTKFIGEDETVDYSGLITHGKEIANKKLRTLQKRLQFISGIEKKIALTEKYQQSGAIYSRQIPKKYFCVTPCEKSFRNADPFEVIRASLDLYYYEDNYDEWLYSELLEYGVLYECTPKKVQYYMFAELPKHIAENIQKNIMLIPAGNYICIQDSESIIERTSQIFSEYLNYNDSFLAIKTDMFTSKYKINKPTSELRVIAL